jgi:hypothetical protein
VTGSADELLVGTLLPPDCGAVDRVDDLAWRQAGGAADWAGHVRRDERAGPFRALLASYIIAILLMAFVGIDLLFGSLHDGRARRHAQSRGEERCMAGGGRHPDTRAAGGARRGRGLCRVKAARPRQASLVMLWALYGAINDMHFAAIPPEVKDMLKELLQERNAAAPGDWS